MRSDEILDVYLRGELVGSLSRVKNAVRFQYSVEVAERHSGAPLLSTALGVQKGQFDAERTRNWFAGLLPEDSRLVELRRFFGVADDSWFDLLREIGRECAGAVEVGPAGFMSVASGGSVKAVTQKELADRICALPSHPYDDESTMRISLGGFQEKLCVIMPDSFTASPGILSIEGASLPVGGSPTTHILKPQPARFPGMVEGEAWGMAAASFATETARTALLELSGAPITLVVERFDRSRDNQGRLVRIHQEDCCQALGLPPAAKYASSGAPRKSDPSFRGIAALLERYSLNPVEEKQRLMRQMVVNYALGNVDAHAKNYALLHDGISTVTLSPLYDVVPAREITPDVLSTGMRIADRIRFDRVDRRSIVDEACLWGLPRKLAEKVLNETLCALREGIAFANTAYPQPAERHSAPSLKRIDALGLGS